MTFTIDRSVPQVPGCEWIYNNREMQWELHSMSLFGRLRHGRVRATLSDFDVIAMPPPLIPSLLVRWGLG